MIIIPKPLPQLTAEYLNSRDGSDYKSDDSATTMMTLVSKVDMIRFTLRLKLFSDWLI